MLEFAAVLALAQQCAPSVAPETLLSVVRTESRYNPNAIGVNNGRRLSRQPTSREEAVRTASALLRAGANFDAGLGQINSSNFRWLGLTVETVFDPCRNLAAAGRVLEANYRSTRSSAADPQSALRAALSMYNTGSPVRGLRNGYVQKVQAAAQYVVPALGGRSAAAPEPASIRPQAISNGEGPPPSAADTDPAAPAPVPPSWDVFGRADRRTQFVFAPRQAPEPAGSARQEP